MSETNKTNYKEKLASALDQNSAVTKILPSKPVSHIHKMIFYCTVQRNGAISKYFLLSIDSVRFLETETATEMSTAFKNVSKTFFRWTASYGMAGKKGWQTHICSHIRSINRLGHTTQHNK